MKRLVVPQINAASGKILKLMKCNVKLLFGTLLEYENEQKAKAKQKTKQYTNTNKKTKQKQKQTKQNKTKQNKTKTLQIQTENRKKKEERFLYYVIYSCVLHTFRGVCSV